MLSYIDTTPRPVEHVLEELEFLIGADALVHEIILTYMSDDAAREVLTFIAKEYDIPTIFDDDDEEEEV